MTDNKHAVCSNEGGKDPVAYQCTSCGAWSAYKLDYNNKMPRGWRDNEHGYFCTECVKKKLHNKGK